MNEKADRSGEEEGSRAFILMIFLLFWPMVLGAIGKAILSLMWPPNWFKKKENLMSDFREPDTCPAMKPDLGLKMYVVVSPTALKAMNGSRGKLGAQCGHGVLHAFWDAEDRFPDTARAYREGRYAYKIVLKLPDDLDVGEAVQRLSDEYKDRCGFTTVVDAGFTVFTEPTLTCVGIGPIHPDDRDEFLKSLKPL